MTWRRAAAATSLLLVVACSLQAIDDNYFDGEDSGIRAGEGARGDASDFQTEPAVGVAGGSENLGGGSLEAPSMEGAVNSNAGAPVEAEAETSPVADSGLGVEAGGASGCLGEVIDACATSAPEVETRACGACGTGQQTRARTCSPDTCTWGAFSAWTSCTGVTAACAPGQTTACANADSCGQRVCSSACSWGACTPRSPGGCLRIGPNNTEEGSNYRCCGTGMWEFCLSTCEWSGNCASCSEGPPSFCTDCYP